MITRLASMYSTLSHSRITPFSLNSSNSVPVMVNYTTICTTTVLPLSLVASTIKIFPMRRREVEWAWFFCNWLRFCPLLEHAYETHLGGLCLSPKHLCLNFLKNQGDKSYGLFSILK